MTNTQLALVGRPWGLQWRSSVWFATFVVGCGIATDLLVYSIPIPFIPFQLQKLHYENVSSLVGWLLFAYSGGLVLSTPPIAMLSERYNNRRIPLIVGLLALVGSQIMFMEAPTYWVLCLARVLQGISSSAVWIVGLALLCDTTPEAHMGRQLGLATSGLTVGLLLGSPLGGVLYKPFGIRGPVIFGICVTLLDLLGRLLIIERKEALRWGYDPVAKTTSHAEEAGANIEPRHSATSADKGPSSPSDDDKRRDKPIEESSRLSPPSSIPLNENHAKDISQSEAAQTSPSTDARETRATPRMISPLTVIIRLARSPRATAAFASTFFFGVALIAQEPTLPLHAQKVWGLDSTKVGLILIGAVLPALISAPLSGWLSDKYGTGLVTCCGVIAAIPWWFVQVLPNSLPLFITAYALASFFDTALFAPLTAELAAVAQSTDGIGYAHVYGAFNLAYGIGSAVGPLIGGQLYDHASHGWSAVVYTGVGCLCVCLVLTFCCAGSPTVLQRLRHWHQQEPDSVAPKADGQ